MLVTGSTGFIGSALVPFLRDRGHDVTRLVRHAPAPGVPQVRWDPAAGTIDAKGLAGIETAIHLAGEGIADRRWTPAQKRRIRDSRTGGTRLLSETLAALDPRPKTLVCASAKDYYGDRGEERLDEEAPRGADFLSLAVDEWEKAADPAVQAGIRVVKFRFGMVLGRSGGGLAKMLLPFRLGLGGRMGSGKQYLSWVALEDLLRAIDHSLTSQELSGPVNLAAPGAVTNAEFTRTLGRALSRPAVLPVPAFALRALFGEVADTLLASVRLDPTRLQSSGFVFEYPELREALRAALKAS